MSACQVNRVKHCVHWWTVTFSSCSVLLVTRLHGSLLILPNNKPSSCKECPNLHDIRIFLLFLVIFLIRGYFGCEESPKPRKSSTSGDSPEERRQNNSSSTITTRLTKKMTKLIVFLDSFSSKTKTCFKKEGSHLLLDGAAQHSTNSLVRLGLRLFGSFSDSFETLDALLFGFARNCRRNGRPTFILVHGCGVGC